MEIFSDAKASVKKKCTVADVEIEVEAEFSTEYTWDLTPHIWVKIKSKEKSTGYAKRILDRIKEKVGTHNYLELFLAPNEEIYDALTQEHWDAINELTQRAILAYNIKFGAMFGGID